MHRWDEAIEAYQDGLKLEDNPALRKGLKEVEEAQSELSQDWGMYFFVGSF